MDSSTYCCIFQVKLYRRPFVSLVLLEFGCEEATTNRNDETARDIASNEEIFENVYYIHHIKLSDKSQIDVAEIKSLIKEMKTIEDEYISNFDTIALKSELAFLDNVDY